MAVTVDLTAEHDEIRSVARRFLEKEYPSARLRALAGSAAGWEPADWEQIAELGWPAISLPETYGGVGYGMAERCLLLEEMGRVLLPGPFLASAVLAADLVALTATEAQRATLLPAIGDGSLLATVVAAGDLYAGADATGRSRPRTATAAGACPAGAGSSSTPASPKCSSSWPDWPAASACSRSAPVRTASASGRSISWTGPGGWRRSSSPGPGPSGSTPRRARPPAWPPRCSAARSVWRPRWSAGRSAAWISPSTTSRPVTSSAGRSAASRRSSTVVPTSPWPSTPPGRPSTSPSM